MKKILIILLFSLISINAQNVLWIDSVSAGPNQTIDFKIKVSNTSPFTAFQLDIQLPGNINYNAGTIALDLLRKVDHVISATLLSNNKLRIIAYSTTRKNFTGDNGPVAKFSCTTKTTPGTFPLTISSAILSDSANSNILNTTHNGQFILLAPDILVSPLTIDFGSVPLGEVVDRNITITNNGNVQLNITDFTSQLAEITFTDSNITSIQAYQSINKIVRFTPVTKGNKNGLLQIKNNDPDDSLKKITVSAFAFAVNEIHIGSAIGRSGFEVELEISINNMESFSAFEFTLDLPSVLRYAANSAILLRKSNHQVFVETLSGNKLKVIAYSSNNSSFIGNNGSILKLKFMVEGQGGYYSLPISDAIVSDSIGTNIISASYSGSVQIAAPSISFQNNSINFGSVSKFDTASVPFVIWNYGNDTLKINNYLFTKSSFWLNASFPITIAPSNQKTVNIFFHNAVKGSYSTALTFYHNDVPRNPSVINLSATVYNPNIISATSVTGTKGDTVSLPFSINNSEPFVAFQFDITLPDSVSFVNSSLILSNRASGSHSITSSFITSNKLRVLAYSMNQSQFSGSAGEVCSFNVILNKKYGEYPLSLSDGIIGNVNNQNIISSMNNGLLKILPDTRASGYFYYDNLNSTRLNNLKVFLKQNSVVIDSAVTDNEGNYFFNHLPDGSYTYNVISSRPWGGGNSTDALLIRRYTVGLHSLSGLRLQCADVNGSNTVNTTDGLLIKRRVTGLISSFTADDWFFENTSLIISGNNIVKNIKGITAGDVNGSYNPSGIWKDGQIYAVSKGGKIVELINDELKYPIYCNTETSIGAITLFLSYPADLIEVTGIESRVSDLLYSISNGSISIAWESMEEIKFSYGEPILNLKIKLKDRNKSIPAALIEVLEGSEIADPEGNVINGIVLNIPEFGNVIPTEFTLKQNYPNPFNPSTTINYELPEEGLVHLELYNLIGEKISDLVNDRQNAGAYKIEWNGEGKPSGIYFYRININGTTKNYSKTIKMIYLK